MTNIQAANQIYKKTKQTFDWMNEFEIRLRSNSESSILVYLEYIQHEMRAKSPNFFRIRTLYERMILCDTFNPMIWDRFLGFLVILSRSSVISAVELNESISCSFLYCRKSCQVLPLVC